MDEKPKAVAWFVDEPIDDGDPLAHIKRRAAALWAAGEVLEQAARSGTVAARADRIDPAAAVTADEAFSADEVREMWQASGLSEDDLDAAANVAFELWTIEQHRQGRYAGRVRSPGQVSNCRRARLDLTQATAGERLPARAVARQATAGALEARGNSRVRKPPMFTDDKFLQVCERYKEIHDGKPLAALTARYDQVLDRRAELEGYARRSGGQDDELDQLSAELTVLEVAIADAKTAVRSQLAAERAAKIAEITRTAQDPANLERPAGALSAPRRW